MRGCASWCPGLFAVAPSEHDTRGDLSAAGPVDYDDIDGSGLEYSAGAAHRVHSSSSSSSSNSSSG